MNPALEKATPICAMGSLRKKSHDTAMESSNTPAPAAMLTANFTAPFAEYSIQNDFSTTQGSTQYNSRLASALLPSWVISPVR